MALHEEYNSILDGNLSIIYTRAYTQAVLSCSITAPTGIGG